jgi:hypothetical protein
MYRYAAAWPRFLARRSSGYSLLIETHIIQRCRWFDPARVRIPLGDNAFGEVHFYGHRRRVRGVKIKHRSFHANGSGQADFEAGISEMLDEAGKIGWTSEWQPANCTAVISSDGSEGPPLVYS